MIKWEDDPAFGKQPPTHGPLRYFTYDHLAGPLRELSETFYWQAKMLQDQLPTGPAKDMALQRLLEAKDSAVRSLAVDGKDTRG